MSLFIPTAVRYRKLRRLIAKVDRAENLRGNLSSLYDSEFREDWVGRWYTVLNPRLNGMRDNSSIPFEYTGDGVSSRAYVERWCMDRMFAASNFIKNKELLDVMTYRIERLDDNDNYLFVLQPVLFDELKRSFKRFAWLGTLVAAAAVCALVFVF